METRVLQGFITEDGKLHVDIPPGLPAGPVEIELRHYEMAGIRMGDLLHSELVGIWLDRTDIDDSVDFARALRRRASRRNGE